MFNKTEHNRALIVMAGCLAFAYLLPFHQRPIASFFNDWFTILGIVVLTAYYAEAKLVLIRLPWIAVVPCGLALVIALQTAMGMLSEPWDALLPIAYMLAAALAIMLGAGITANGNGAAKLCLVLAVAHLFAALVSVVIASLQLSGAELPFAPFMMAMVHAPDVSIRPHANIGQPNQLAFLICVAIASVWWLFQKGRVKAYAAIAGVIVLLWGLTLTQSRIGWLIIPGFAFMSVIWRGKAQFKPVSLPIIAGLLLLYVLLVIALPEITAALNITAPSVAPRTSGISGRKELYAQAWHISLTHPWFGAGWAQFGPQQVMNADFPISVYAQHAHNLILNFAAEIGWPLTLIFCAVFAIWIFRAYFFRSLSHELAFGMLFFIAVLVYSMVEFPLWYAIVLMPFALLVGMTHQLQFGAKQIELRRHYVLLVVFVMASSSLLVGMDFRRVLKGYHAVEFESMGIKLDSTATERPAFTIFPYVYDYFEFLDKTVHPGMSPEEIAFMEKVTRRFGGKLSLIRMSQVYAMNGREDDAVNAALAVRRLHGPHYEQVYEDWRRAPEMYQNIFKRLPSPESTTAAKVLRTSGK